MKITKTIFVFDLDNPPLPDRTADAKIEIQNQKRISLTNWARSGNISEYRMIIIEPDSIGLSGTSQNEVNNFFELIALAFNLKMINGSMILHAPIMANGTIEKEKLKPKPPEIEKNGSVTKMTFHEVVEITDSYRLGVQFEEKIDENDIVNIIKKIQTMSNTNSTTVNIQDLKKSIDVYQSACSSFDRPTIFKNLFNSLELATNSDGIDRSGTSLDNEVSKLTSEQQATIEKWRNFNSRSKHVNRSPADQLAYSEGLKDLPSWINPLRKTCQQIILPKLFSL